MAGPSRSTQDAYPTASCARESFDCGQLMCIKLRQFMAFRDTVKVSFSPLTNLIASCNGVGKSTIVTAIHFALGCGAKSNSSIMGRQNQPRGQQLLPFFSYGCNKASVTLDLRGPSPTEIVRIKRTIEKTTQDTIKSFFFINGQEVKIGAVHDEWDRLHLKIDNYLCFMQQEKVALFGQLTPTELLAKTLAAINEADAEALETFRRKQEVLQRSIECSKTHNERMIVLLQKRQSLSLQQSELAKYWELKKQLVVCKGRTFQLQINAARRAHNEAKEELNTQTDVLRRYQSSVELHATAIKEDERIIGEGEGDLKSWTSSLLRDRNRFLKNIARSQKLFEECDALASNPDDVFSAEEREAKMVELQKDKILDLRATQMMLLQQIRDAESELDSKLTNEIVGGDGRNESDIEALSSVSDLQQAFDIETETVVHLRKQMYSLERQKFELERERNRVIDQQELQKVTRQKQRELGIQQEQQMKLKALGGRFEDREGVWRGLQLLRQHKFRAPVFGPLYSLVKVRKQEVRTIAEHHLQHKFCTFLCLDAHDDFQFLVKNNIRCFALNNRSIVPVHFEITDSMRKAGVISVLMDELVLPEEAKTVFAEYTMCHLCFICRPDLTAAEEENMQRIMRRDLIHQGFPGQELVYYTNRTANRVRGSRYDIGGTLHLVTQLPVRQPVLDVADSVEKNTSEIVYDDERDFVRRVEEIENQLTRTQEQQDNTSADSLKHQERRERIQEKLKRRKCATETVMVLRRRESDISRDLDRSVQEMKTSLQKFQNLAKLRNEIPRCGTSRKNIVKSQLSIQDDMSELLSKILHEIPRIRAKEDELETVRIGLEEKRATLQEKERKIQPIRGAVEMCRTRVVEARQEFVALRRAYEQWREEALSFYIRMLALNSRSERGMEAVDGCHSRVQNSDVAEDDNIAGDRLLQDLRRPGLPETIQDLHQEQIRLQSCLDRSDVNHQVLNDIEKNEQEIREVEILLRSESEMIHDTSTAVLESSRKWMEHLRSITSVLSKRFNSFMRFVSDGAEGELSLVEAPEIPLGKSSKTGSTQLGTCSRSTRSSWTTEGNSSNKIPNFQELKLVLKVSFSPRVPMRRISTINSGGERSIVAVLYLLSVQAFARGSFRVLDEINQGLDSTRECLLFKLLTHVAEKDRMQQTMKYGRTQSAADLSFDDIPYVRLPSKDAKNSRRRNLYERQFPDVKKRKLEDCASIEGDNLNQGTATHREGTYSGSVQYILLTPHVIPRVNFNDLTLQFIFSGPHNFDQKSFDIEDQCTRSSRLNKDYYFIAP